MRRHSVRFLATAVVCVLMCAATLVAPVGAFAYSLSGWKWQQTNSTWPQYRVYVDYHTLPLNWQVTADVSRGEWNTAGSSKEYFYYTSSGAHDLYKGAYGNTSWLALTTVIASAGWISDSGTKVNTDFSWNVDGLPTPLEYDLQSCMTHELGHWLRLNHSSASFATMNATLPSGTWWARTLTSDDIAGIKAIYGAK